MNLPLKKEAILIANYKDKEKLDMMTFILDSEGYETLVVSFEELNDETSLRDKITKFSEFKTVIFDIPPPYHDNFDLYLKFRNLDPNNKNHNYVITIDNKYELAKISQEYNFTVLQEPYDLIFLLNAIEKKVEIQKESNLPIRGEKEL